MDTKTEERLQAAREEAARIVSGQRPCPASGEVAELGRALQRGLEFGLARKLIARALEHHPNDAGLIQQLALCTYKDEELIPARRYGEALALLEKIGLRDPDHADPAQVPPETLPRTLALGGAVYKRLFESTGQLDHLHRALALYRAAWDRNPKLDMGFGGVNAAYVLDLLAFRLESAGRRTGTASAEAGRMRGEARALRELMARQLPMFANEEESAPAREGQAMTPYEQQYWYVVTLAQIHFGLGAYEEAGRWLAEARALESTEWERQTTFRQLVAIARLQGHVTPKEGTPPEVWSAPWRALAQFFERGADHAFSCGRGKVGLALSGGGFRASLFHLGVLARLADMDALRSVEVLSTVSGGSIVGAHYYLEVRHLLNTHPDEQITREDYIEIVRRVQKRFLLGVQQNLRTRALTNLACNFKMLLPRLFGAASYTRSHRLGELYEERLYSAVDDEHQNDAPRPMPGLRITPAGEPDAGRFKPKFANWRRRAKVPVLLLNTTSLNSGHNWHFTATWMGEPPGLVGEEIDVNARYRRLWYEQAPTEELRNYRLGYAVAASACVPALFAPLEVAGLYPGRTVRLVDGGVHDNQGVESLLDESCSFLLCSDASGQMADNPSPSNGLLGVPLRANSILMDRVREAEYQDLRAREEDRALQGLFFIHLKKDLVPAALDWVACQDPSREPPRLNTTPYGVDRDLQRRLAALRTDLDSFTEVEAFALMLSGYLMTEQETRCLDQEYRQVNAGALAVEAPDNWGGFDVNAGRSNWAFLDPELERIMGKPDDSSDLRRRDLGRQLEVGAACAFKVWRLVPGLRATAAALGGATGVGLLWLLFSHWNQDLGLGNWTLGEVVVAVGLLLAGLVVPALQWLNPEKAMRSWTLKLGLAVLGWLAANVHVLLFDPLFLRRGQLKRLLKLPAE